MSMSYHFLGYLMTNMRLKYTQGHKCALLWMPSSRSITPFPTLLFALCLNILPSPFILFYFQCTQGWDPALCYLLPPVVQASKGDQILSNLQVSRSIQGLAISRKLFGYDFKALLNLQASRLDGAHQCLMLHCGQQFELHLASNYYPLLKLDGIVD